jgi:hypothetical protein
VPRTRLPRDQAPRLGRRAGGCRALPPPSRPRRTRRRPDVRRLGRLHLPDAVYLSPRLSGGSTAGTRSRCASSA